MNTARLVALIAGFLLFSSAPASAADIEVDLELLLLVDVSGSVSTSEYNLMMGGYDDAFGSAAVINGIAAGTQGKIAVALGFWSSSGQWAMGQQWTIVTPANSSAFGDTLGALTRPFSGGTQPNPALIWGTDQVTGNQVGGSGDNILAGRQVIDISGDGSGSSVTTGRDYALQNGIDTINGLPIGTTVGGSLYNYYLNYLIGGSDPFIKAAATFSDFTAAVEDKLTQEISGIPEPGTLALFGLGIAGMGAGILRRRRRASR